MFDLKFHQDLIQKEKKSSSKQSQGASKIYNKKMLDCHTRMGGCVVSIVTVGQSDQKVEIRSVSLIAVYTVPEVPGYF